MKIDPNDPKLTAYALGELDEAEQAAVERELIRSDAARQAVEEIQATAGLLKEEFSSEPGLQLSESQNALIEHRLDSRTTRNPWTTSRVLYAGGALLAAASLFLVVYLNWSAKKIKSGERIRHQPQRQNHRTGNSPSIVVQESPKPVEVTTQSKAASSTSSQSDIQQKPSGSNRQGTTRGRRDRVDRPRSTSFPTSIASRPACPERPRCQFSCRSTDGSTCSAQTDVWSGWWCRKWHRNGSRQTRNDNSLL